MARNSPATVARPPTPAARPLTTADRIAALEVQLSALRERQRADLVYAIAAVVGGRAFTAAELWQHAARLPSELRTIFAEVGITSARRLGKRLQQFQTVNHGGATLVRIGADKTGAIWTVRVAANSHLDHLPPGPPDV